jgi:shikimate dehydrogenase
MTRTAQKLVGLIGWPVEHSVSPAMHNAAFARLGLDWRYVLMPTEPAGVEAIVKGLRQAPYRGANVTIPHKQAVIDHLDSISATASIIGAVNTIVADGDRLTGHNTDADGFLAALRAAGFEPAGCRALVLGAGGAARSVVYALASEACAVTIHNRTRSRAERLVEDLRRMDLPGAVARLDGETNLSGLDLGAFDLLVNATSVGMWPDQDTSPWPDKLAMPAHWAVFDLVYNPAETRLLAQARASGATAIGGLSMLVHQGALAFELWTGQTAPLDVMHAAASAALGFRMEED